MVITLDAGKISPVIILYQGSPIVQLYQNKLKWFEPMFKPIIKDILRAYHPNTYQYTPNPDYNAADYICNKLSQQGFECTIKLIQ